MKNYFFTSAIILIIFPALVFLLDIKSSSELLCTELQKVSDSASSDKYELMQNYPNPFNSSTTISFSISKPGNVSLKIYNILGKEVAILVDGSKSPGKYNLKFDASNLPGGIYFYTLRIGNYLETKRLVLLK